MKFNLTSFLRNKLNTSTFELHWIGFFQKISIVLTYCAIASKCFGHITNVNNIDTNFQSWDPKKTWVFAVGIIDFSKSKSFDSFTGTQRKDVVFIDTLIASGVPKSKIVFLQDNEATSFNVFKMLRKTLRKVEKDETFLFYYTGHGHIVKNGDVVFVASDTQQSPRSIDLPVKSIVKLLKWKINDSRIILIADACYSGELCESAKKLGIRSFVCMTSSDSITQSTANWTFTEALIDSFSGHGFVDFNHDNRVTLDELKLHTERDLTYFENQIPTILSKGVGVSRFVLSSVKAADKNEVNGIRIQVNVGKKWFFAKILGSANGKFLVRYIGYDSKFDEWVSENQIRSIPKPDYYPVGADVEAFYSSKWYPAKILDQKHDIYFISYVGYSSKYNQWVGADYIRRK